MSEGMSEAAGGNSQEVYVTLDAPTEVSRLRFFNMILAIPMLIIARVVEIIAGLVWIASLFVVLITGSYPEGIYRLGIRLDRFGTRVIGYLLYFLKPYPPLRFISSTDDPQDYPIRINYPPRPDRVPRYAIVNFILAIPHFIVLAILGLGYLLWLIYSALSVLIFGSYPPGYQRFGLKFANYYYRVAFFVSMIKPAGYPKFSLQ